MLAILISAATSLIISLVGTPLLIKVLVSRQYGQFIRQDGPTTHLTKRGTPTMGGVIIILATVIGYTFANLVSGRGPNASGLLLLFLMVGLGLIGFLDDFAKIRHKQSEGLTPWAKIIGQAFIGITFAVLALQFRNADNRTPASTRMSFIRDSNIDLAFWGAGIGLVLFVIWANFLITAWSNAVNLTDGLDGLAAGASMIAFGAYTLLTTWQSNQACYGVLGASPGCYDIRDPRDLAIVSAAIVGACFGFLWWNTSPAQIFMGDTGSLALGGAFAGLSILTHTEFLAVIIGGLYLLEVLSDVIQVGFFKLTRKRVFRMAPLHHHFELKGWKEVTVVVRFWIIAALFAVIAVGIFYGEWLAKQ
ncbi:MAG: phospho-N-acetylmuramoyl-pentapeptide-transferase [Ancrocorticia sp.]|uniref:phospho-N-acetylmuramoyl-pentapeptide- transferase n=1 Tax=Ancrocorticia sp. TaxID=2593684 RepID=UPI003F92F68D